MYPSLIGNQSDSYPSTHDAEFYLPFRMQLLAVLPPFRIEGFDAYWSVVWSLFWVCRQEHLHEQVFETTVEHLLTPISVFQKSL